jgi:hypothetical protein
MVVAPDQTAATPVGITIAIIGIAPIIAIIIPGIVPAAWNFEIPRVPQATKQMWRLSSNISR